MARPLRPEVLDQLTRHGIRPGSDASLDRVRTFVRDLYNFELRRQRDRVRAGQLSKDELVEEVIELRRKYWVLSLPLDEWRS